jgi:DNA modification methylase
MSCDKCQCDAGYNLPPLKVIYHEIKVSHINAGEERDGQKIMFRNAAAGLREAAREKRDTMHARVEKMMEILREDPDSHYLLWHDLEDERRAIKAALPEAVEVYGTQDLEEREQNVIDFSDGKIKYLATKPELSGSGCNFQRHCHKCIFLGIGYKFNDFIQSIHRIHRYLQSSEVEVHIIYADSERDVLDVLKQKWAQHEDMAGEMSKIIREYGLDTLSLAEPLKRSLGVDRREERGESWLVANNDCVDEARHMETNSVDMILTSIPFSNHYEYTPSYNDFGHTDNNEHFWAQMDFLTPELIRILKPGRIAAIHTKDRILFGNVTGAGAPTVSPFHAEAIFHYRKHGFDYMGLITVVTDVVRENNQTYRLGWTEQCKDGTKMGVGSPEYIVLLRKPQTDRTRGYADAPVTKQKPSLSFSCKNCGYQSECPESFSGDELPDGSMASECPQCGSSDEPENIHSPGYSRARWQIDAHAFWRSSGNRLLLAEELAKLPHDSLVKAFGAHSLKYVYDYAEHVAVGEQLEVRGALPATFMSIAPASHDPDVWTDVNRMLTLNSDQHSQGREKHVCPLQVEIVDRLITRYTNKGELVFDPFGGLFTVPVRAIRLDRKGRAVELNPGYFKDGVGHLLAMQEQKSIPDLFALIEAEGKAA